MDHDIDKIWVVETHRRAIVGLVAELPSGRPGCPLSSLVTEEARAKVDSTDGFRFCPEPACELAYFNLGTGDRFLRGDVSVRIGQKETSTPRPICYCFDHSVEDIEAEVSATGTSKIPAEIREKCRQGLDRCDVTNPQGSCCLGDVLRVFQEAQARRGDASAEEGRGYA